MKTIFAYAIAWFGLVILAVINGTMREKQYCPSASELSAHKLSAIVGPILFGACIWILAGIFRMESPTQAVVIGGLLTCKAHRGYP